jgi:hypothetical protein
VQVFLTLSDNSKKGGNRKESKTSGLKVLLIQAIRETQMILNLSRDLNPHSLGIKKEIEKNKLVLK